MKNFKEIAKKCLAGELSGTFVFQNGQTIASNKLRKFSKESMHDDYIYYFNRVCTLDQHGFSYNASNNIINFIPNNMQEQITIDIPEGMEVIQDETPDGIKIKFIKKSLSYEDIENKLSLHTKIQTKYFWDSNVNEGYFSRKIEVLRKLINIRNYFGKPDGTKCGYYIYKSAKGFQVAPTGYPCIYANDIVAFKEKEHAEQAIKMLGNELKYLFEPW